MIKKIAHLADIHVRKSPLRYEEYQLVFNNLINSLSEKKPDRIVIIGDLVHDYLDLQGEQLILVRELLKSLSKIAPVRIVRGNHDFLRRNSKRIDSVKAIVKTLENIDVIYYDKTGMYRDDNITWCVWHHGEQKNNPWMLKKSAEYIENNKDTIFIDLFHDPISGCITPSGFEKKSKLYYNISDFKGDLSLFGDIHKMQFLNKEKTKAYCGSLIAQDISEGDDAFHGYLFWDVDLKSAELVSVYNEYSFKNVRISQYTDFDDLDFDISNPTKYMTVRFIWNTLPQTRTFENERKLNDYVKSKYNNSTIKILNTNDFIESDNIEIKETVTLNNISSNEVQHEIFKEYLAKIGCDEKQINDVIALDNEVLKEIEIDDDFGVEWDIIKFGGVNFMSYAQLDVDWRNMTGLFQITGVNTAGKTTIMKLISYILFNKTLETETRVKFGDIRYINNRNGAEFCEGYLVLYANGEYYGIKRRTEIQKNKSGDIIGVPTTLNYYLLNDPDDVLSDDNNIDKLDGDRRVKTQNKLNSIIGSYDNFMRIVMTTSDTLNRILSNDMAVFVDSLLYDSGLDIFDKKLEGWKILNKRFNEKPKISCDISAVTQQNKQLNDEIFDLENKINKIETEILPDLMNRISTGKNYIENLTKKLYKIDDEIYNLDVSKLNNDISIRNKIINDLKNRQTLLMKNISELKESYDEKRLNDLLEKKETQKSNEYALRLKIKESERIISDEQHSIEIINGDNYRLKNDIDKINSEIVSLKNSKICKLCGQLINKPEHIEHINKTVAEKNEEITQINKKIKENEEKIPIHLNNIETQRNNIQNIKSEIEKMTLDMESILKEIGILNNDKNDVEKRKELQNELDKIPIKIQNEELSISICMQKINNYENSLKQIEENKKIENQISLAKSRLETLENEERDVRESIILYKTAIADKHMKIKTNNNLIDEFKKQEYVENIMKLYKKCVHRDGIPKQMLSNYILPKINQTLGDILSVAPFKIWLDENDFKPKLMYYSRPNSIIDCISASGKERTFSSVVLKFALNQINVKSKPTLFLLDEVTGKLDENSIEEFVDMLHLIKNSIKRILVVEYKHEINPKYVINVELDDNGISSLSIE